MDSHLRSLAKAVCWRVTALIITGCVTWVVTRDLSLAAAIGGLDLLLKIGTYYLHERIWDGVRFGRIRKPDYEI